MSKASYLLKMPRSVKEAAARLAKEDGVSLNQFIAVAVAEKVGTIETAEQFLKRRAAKAKPADLMRLTSRGGPIGGTCCGKGVMFGELQDRTL